MKKLLIAAAVAVLGATGAQAADIAARPYTKAPILNPAYNWSGFYVGGNLGASFSDANPSNSIACGAPGVADYICSTGNPASQANAPAVVNSLVGSSSNSNVTGGVHAGYNQQAGLIVYGGEIDVGYFNFGTSQLGRGVYPAGGGGGAALAGDSFVAATSVSSDVLATLRGRLGYLISPNLLGYATGGLAIGRVKTANSFADSHTDGNPVGAGGFGERTETKVGWTVGAGLEYAFAQNWSVRAEYMYLDLGSSSVNTLITNAAHASERTPFNTSVDLTAHLVRAGVSYKFQ
ncbi:MAG: porin family protein [Afipia sp.]|nr:porin family protein [Afipia sp.]